MYVTTFVCGCDGVPRGILPVGCRMELLSAVGKLNTETLIKCWRIPRFSGFAKRKIAVRSMDGICEVSKKGKKGGKQRSKEEGSDCWYRTNARSRGIDDYMCAPQLPVISIYLYAFYANIRFHCIMRRLFHFLRSIYW